MTFPVNAEPSPPEPPATLYAALAHAQAEFGAISRSKTVSVRTKAGGTYSFSYAPLEAILKATLPALNKHGFSLTQAVEGDALVTRLYHASGGSLENHTKIIVGESGPQAYGSALTYSRRYGVTLLLGVCADDDDDGNAAEGNEAHAVHRPLDPRGDGHKSIPADKAEKYAERFRGALAVGLDDAVYEVHAEVVGDPDLYIAISDRLTAGQRRELKECVARVRDAMPKMMANGRAAPAAR